MTVTSVERNLLWPATSKHISKLMKVCDERFTSVMVNL